MSVEERATAADRVLAARERYVARGVSTPTLVVARAEGARVWEDRKSTRLNSSHSQISYAAFCWKKKPQPLRRSARLSPHVACDRPPRRPHSSSPRPLSASRATAPSIHYRASVVGTPPRPCRNAC